MENNVSRNLFTSDYTFIVYGEMMDTRLPIMLITKSGVIEILLYLLSHKSASRSELRDNIDAVLETLYKTSLPTLKELSLIAETTRKTFPFTVEIALTEKGRKVAEKLKEIQKILDNA